MPKKNDLKPKKILTGLRFGKLTVMEYAGYNVHTNNTIQHKWKCVCDCGNEKEVETRHLLSGHCKSCGCMPHRPTNPNHKHYLTDTPLYNVWKSMKGRCYVKTNSSYKHYGARGITVCEEWKNDFMNFYNWALANGYDPNGKSREYTLDRIDVNGNYEPNNCRFVNMLIQANNKTDTKRHLVNGEYLTIRETSEKYGVDYKRLKGLHDKGMEIQEAITHQTIIGNQYTYKGESHNLTEWARIYNIKPITLHARVVRYGWDLEKALTTPISPGKGWRTSYKITPAGIKK